MFRADGGLYGGLETMPRFRMMLELRRAEKQRLLQKVRKPMGRAAVRGCWTWQGTLRAGVPVWCYAGYQWDAARVVFYVCTGVDPRSSRLRRACQEPLCVRPEHHQIVGQAELAARAREARRARGVDEGGEAGVT